MQVEHHSRILSELRNSPFKSASFTYKLEFITPNGRVSATAIDTIDIRKDYGNEFTDDIEITAQIPLGTLIGTLEANRDTLKAVLTREYYSSDVGGKVATLPSVSTRYDCTLKTGTSRAITDAGGIIQNSDIANKHHLAAFTVQLVDERATEYIQRKVSCILRNVTMAQVLETLVSGNFSTNKGDLLAPISKDELRQGAYTTPVGHEIYPPDNTKVYKQVVIDIDESDLVNLVPFLQEKYGIYNNGAGSYMHRGIVYVYPLHDFKRFTSTTNTLTIANFPEDAATELELTFKQMSAGGLYVAATDNVSHSDAGEWNIRNHGTGTFHTDASAMVGQAAGRVKPDILTVNPNLLQTTIIDQRPDALNKLALSPRKSTINTCIENSRASQLRAAMLTVNWQNSAPELLTPGMPVQYLIPVKGKMQVMNGTLTLIDTGTSPVEGNITGRGYRSNTMLGIMVESVRTLKN